MSLILDKWNRGVQICCQRPLWLHSSFPSFNPMRSAPLLQKGPARFKARQASSRCVVHPAADSSLCPPSPGADTDMGWWRRPFISQIKIHSANSTQVEFFWVLLVWLVLFCFFVWFGFCFFFKMGFWFWFCRTVRNRT